MSTIVAEQFREVRKNTLRGFARVRFPSGLILDEVSIHASESGKCWASPPSRPVLDPDGNPRRGPDGKLRYGVLVSFAAPEIRTAWSGQVIEAVRAKFPTALSGPLERISNEC